MNPAVGSKSARRPLALGFITLIVLIGGFGAWSVLTTISGAIIAQGQIEVSLSRQVVQHPDGGVVSELIVHEGSIVSQGEVLLRLDGTSLRSEFRTLESQLFELSARRARLEAQSRAATDLQFSQVLTADAAGRQDYAQILHDQQSLFIRQRETLGKACELRLVQIAQIEQQMDGLSAQARAINQQLDLLNSDADVQRELLRKGLTQSARVLELERERAQLIGNLGEVNSNRAQAQIRITEIKIEVEALTSERSEQAESELRSVMMQQLELLQRKAMLAEKITRLDIRAPASGVVFGLKVTTLQSVVRSAEPLMYIVPQDRPLLVAARVPVTHIDEVHVGQSVHLVFSALPSRIAPNLYGQVELVSPDILVDERSGAAYYRIEIALNAADIRKELGADIVPGMPVQTYIRTVDRSPFSYLTKPLADYFRMAFRET